MDNLRTALAAPEPYDQQSLELCGACGWKAVIPGEPCLMCARDEITKERDSYAKAADMLDADAVRADKRVAAIAADREYWREKAQQVAVPDKRERPQNCGTGHCSCLECPYPKPDWSAA